MTPLSLGIFASANFTIPTSFESIATVTVGSGGAADVQFTSIPGTYTHLQIRGIARGTTSANDVLLRIRLNSDTGNNYARHILVGDGSSATAGNDASQSLAGLGIITAASATASIFGTAVADILDYKDTNKYKTIRSISGNDRNGAGTVGLYSSLWMSTNAITSVTIFPASDNFAQYSHFALYGIRSA